jgi:hypothetical protein
MISEQFKKHMITSFYKEQINKDFKHNHINDYLKSLYSYKNERDILFFRLERTTDDMLFYNNDDKHFNYLLLDSFRWVDINVNLFELVDNNGFNVGSEKYLQDINTSFSYTKSNYYEFKNNGYYSFYVNNL